MSQPDPKRELLRHTLATLAYRGRKAVTGVDPGFGSFRAHESIKAPVAILAHIGDLLEWAASHVRGEERWSNSEPGPWEREVERFFEGLATLDRLLAESPRLACSEERLFQGPIADALTHVGQIAMLRRTAAAPVRGENYLRAEIQAGRVGREQAPPVREFD
jgi:hypothetical protein